MAETKSLKTALKELTTVDKILLILMIACLLAIVVMAVLRVTGVWEKAGYVLLLLVGAVCLLEVGFCWKRQRVCSAIYFFAAVITFNAAIRYFV